jgi:hypothetical protein
MGFPYLSPLKEWTVKVLNKREENPQLLSLRMPFVILVSGAKVVKSSAKKQSSKERTEELKKILGNEGEGYNGCIISNQNDISLNYQTSETIVGIDFTGKPIKVEGETNRRISTPIIESLEIDTDGANNTLKIARLKVKCFSLKQFEMFELFFCKPGMNLLVEYGDSSINRMSEPGKFNNITEALIPKGKTNNLSAYESFCKNFSKYYRADLESLRALQKTIKESNGSYDLVAGKVVDYSFSIEGNGIYNVDIEINQGNQISLAIPINVNSGTSAGKTPAKDNPNIFEQSKNSIVADFNIDKKIFDEALQKYTNPSNDWKNDFFNFGKVNKEKKDETASTEPYLSFRFILKVLCNISVSAGGLDEAFFKFPLPSYKLSGKNTEIIPIKIHKNILASSDEVIFPNKKLPRIDAPTKPKGNTSSEADNQFKLNEKNTIDASINGYSLELDSDPILEKVENQNITIQIDGDYKIGNALNIFVKYKSVLEAWRKSYTRIDFITKIINLINSNGYGLYKLVYACPQDTAPASLIDYKLINKIDNTIPYRFKPTTISSIVKDFSFNFEMSNLVAGRSIFNAQKFMKNIKNAQKDEHGEIALPDEAYQSVDYSMFSNSDGFYSINKIDLKAVTDTVQIAVSKGVIKEGGTPEKIEEGQASNLTQLIQEKSTKFKLPNGKIETLIFNDNKFILDKINSEEQSTNSTLTPIEITITIDGMSGFNCGEYFHIDGVPEIYNQIGVFQITNTKHNLDKDGWNTIIEAGFRINKK